MIQALMLVDTLQTVSSYPSKIGHLAMVLDAPPPLLLLAPQEQRVGTPCKRRLHAQRLLFIPVQRYGSASRRVLRNPYAGAVRQWHGLQPHLGV